jgi:hypothetical protein
MKLDANIPKAIDRTALESAALETAGFDGIWIGETQHDPFLMSLRAVDATELQRMGLGRIQPGALRPRPGLAGPASH